MNLLHSRDFWIESAASTLTLAGIYVGSTTALGASLYLLSLIPWVWAMIRKRLWGLIPLNVATFAICVINLWRA